MKTTPTNPFGRSFQPLNVRRSGSFSFLRYSASLGLAGAFLIQPVSAANVWDGGGASGAWSDLSNWDANTTPVSPTALQFGGILRLNSGNDLFAAGTLFNGITFNAGAGAFILTGNSITLGGNVVNSSTNNQTINLDLAMSAARTFTTNGNGGNLTLGGVVSGTGFNLVKSGLGTLTLNGGAAHTYTGQTQVDGGTLLVDFANMATPTDLISSTTTLRVGAGTFSIKGKSVGTTSQTLGAVSQNGTTYGRIVVDSNGGGGTTLALGALSHNAGSTTQIDISSSGSVVTTSGTVTNGLLNSSYTVKDATGTGFATKSGANIVRYDDTTGTTLTNAATVAATNYTTLASGAALTLLGGAQSLNSLAIDTTNGTQAINLNAGIKTLTGQGVLFRGANDATLSNGQLGANNAETIFHHLGTGKLTVSGTVGSGTASITKDGSGELVLSGANTYTGGTRVLEGTLTVNNALGATAVIVGGAAGTTGTSPVFTLGAGSSITGGSIQLLNANAVANAEAVNAISQTTTLTLTTGTLNLNAANARTGTIAVNAGFTLGIGDNDALGSTSLTLGGGTLRANGGSRTIANAFSQGNANSTIGGSFGLTFSSEFNNLGSATLTINNTALTTFSGGISLRESGVAQRSLTFNGTGDLALTGIVRNNTTFNGILDFKGSGITTISGNNTYSGTTTVGGVINAVNTTPTVKLGHANALGFGGVSAVAGNTTVNTGATLDLNGQVGIQEPIAINGTGAGNNGALINSNTATEAVIENGLASIGMGAVGTGYADGAYAVAFTGGGGTGAAATATVLGGVVVSVQVTNAGSGYSSNPAASISGAGSGATFNSSASSVTLGSASSIGGAGNIRINAVVTGGNSLSKVGAGILTLAAANTYTGATAITGGTLALTGSGSIASSPNIIVGAATTFDVSGVSGGYTLGAAQTLSGTGTITGAASIAGTLSPGSSPGTLSTGSQTWLNGGDYNWQIADAVGATGVGSDSISITGSLDLTNLTAAGFAINLWSLSSIAPDVNGDAANFINTTDYSWTLLTTSGGITGFDAANFVIRTVAFNGTGGFANPLGDGVFSVAQSGNNLVLNFTAVPEPGAALIGGLAVLALLRRRRLS